MFPLRVGYFHSCFSRTRNITCWYLPSGGNLHPRAIFFSRACFSCLGVDGGADRPVRRRRSPSRGDVRSL